MTCIIFLSISIKDTILMLRDIGRSDAIITAGIPTISSGLAGPPVTRRSTIAGVPCAAGRGLIGGGTPSRSCGR